MDNSMKTELYEHLPLNTEVKAIAGHQVVTGEFRLPFDGREVLYLVGYAVMDSS